METKEGNSVTDEKKGEGSNLGIQKGTINCIRSSRNIHHPLGQFISLDGVGGGAKKYWSQYSEPAAFRASGNGNRIISMRFLNSKYAHAYLGKDR